MRVYLLQCLEQQVQAAQSLWKEQESKSKSNTFSTWFRRKPQPSNTSAATTTTDARARAGEGGSMSPVEHHPGQGLVNSKGIPRGDLSSSSMGLSSPLSSAASPSQPFVVVEEVGSASHQ